MTTVAENWEHYIREAIWEDEVFDELGSWSSLLQSSYKRCD